jgi:O-methyltransferase domain/Dimerisation domain
MEHQAPPQSAVMHIIAGYWLSRAVYLAARLKLADAVGESGASLAALASATGTRPDRLQRLLRALASHGFFRQQPDGTFVQTPLSQTLLSGVPASMRALAEAELGRDHYESWRDIESCLRTGGTAFERQYGMPIWRYYAETPEAGALFGQAMTGFTAVANAGILGSYKFNAFAEAVDVGGGHGSFLLSILEQQPSARVILFDLPTVAAEVEKKGLPEPYRGRVEVSAGDFFQSVPTGGDLYLMKFILHDWDDEHAIKILANVRRGIDPKGRLAVIEIVLPPHNEPHLGPLIDLNMMVMTGGAERTETGYRDLLARAGFRLERVVATKSPFSVIEAVPR